MSDVKAIIAARVAQELHDGDVVNLGIGLPTLVVNYLPKGVDVILQSENGIMGMGGSATGEDVDGDIVNAGGAPVTVKPGAMYFDSSTSFGIIRGGHVDATVLGALEVDEAANLSNWIVPGKMVPGMGGAMDLVVGAKNVIVAMQHCNVKKDKVTKEVIGTSPKILHKNTLPYTAIHCVSMIVTEMCVFRYIDGKLTLTELNPAYTVDDIKANTEADFVVADDLKEMYVYEG